MKAFRPGSPWRGSGLLLGLLLGGLLLSPTASQDRAMQLQALKTAVPASQRRIAASVRAAVQMVSQNGMDAARAQVEPGLRLHSPGHAEVYIYTSTLPPATLDALRQHGVQVLRSAAQFGIVYARAPLDSLEAVAALPFVRSIGSPAYSMRRTGSVTSAGDTVMRADLVRAMGVTGHGVKVGIIADSLRDPATSINSGDLPATVTIVNGQDGSTDRTPAMKVGPWRKSSMIWRQGPTCSSGPVFLPVWISLLLSRNSRQPERMSSWMTSAFSMSRSLKRDQWPRPCARPFSKACCS